MKKVHEFFCFIVIILIFASCSKSTQNVIPMAPTELIATITSKSQIDLSWKDNSTNETGYKIERKTDLGVFAEIGSSNNDITIFSDKNVSINTKYTYRVYSYNEVGKSVQYSNEVIVKILDIPILTTTDVTEIKSIVAKSGGNISSDGGSPITSRGVVWSTTNNPTIALSTKTNDGSGTGSFQSSITGLTAETKYYVRAYATNSEGTAYGKELSFLTLNIPTIKTFSVTEITSTTAKSGGDVVSDGGSPIISRGVVWGLSNNPTISLTTKTSDGAGIGTFASKIENLNPAEKYYVRAYATNAVGTSYGEEIIFSTSIITGISTLGTVIGANGRIWLDRNLGAERVALDIDDKNSFGDLYQWGRSKDGHQLRTSDTTSILSSSDVTGHGLFIIPSNFLDWRVAQNDKLWQGVNGVNNGCPVGFRLPTADEWNAELSSWSRKDAASAFASPLKLPMSGRRGSDVISYHLSGYWSSTVSGKYCIRFAFEKSGSLSGSTPNPWVQEATRAWGFSVRCIKD